MLCVEVIKQKMTPKEFWRNFKELQIPIEHQKELCEAIEKTSEQYQKELASAALGEGN